MAGTPLLSNRRILAVDPAGPVTEAVRVKTGRAAHVGTNRDMRKSQDPELTFFDGQHRMGHHDFIDSHDVLQTGLPIPGINEAAT